MLLCFSVWCHPFNILKIGYLKHKFLIPTLHFHQPELQAAVTLNLIYEWSFECRGHGALKYTIIHYKKYFSVCICGMNVETVFCFAALEWKNKGVWGFRDIDSCSKTLHHFTQMFFKPNKLLWLQPTFFLNWLFFIDACVCVYICKLTASICSINTLTFPSQLSSKFYL